MTSFNKKRAYRSILLAASVLSLFTYTNASASELEASTDNIEEEKAEFDDVRNEEEVLEGEEIPSPDLKDVEITDDIEIDSEEENSLDILEVREATMEVFTSRSSNHPIYTTTFINTISPSAVKLGEEYGLYPSVIIAQAALESGWGGHSPALPDDYVLSLPPNHNLFGVKGDYKGNSVLVNTKEYDKAAGKYIEIVDKFRKYPSYYESLLDYATKMRYNTTTTDPYFYSGVWIENTTSYKDATAFLTGRYATDPEYGDKLNNIIVRYNLTQYDSVKETPKDDEEVEEKEESTPDNQEVYTSERALSRQEVAYRATLNKNIDIYNVPGYEDGYKKVGTSNDYLSNTLVINKELTTERQTWVEIKVDNNVIGWVRKTDIKPNYANVRSQREVAYNATISNSNINIYSFPAWSEGNKLVADSDDYIGENFVVKEEMVTDEATYAFLEHKGKPLGWININGIRGVYNSVSETREVAYNATISNTNINFYNVPAWTRGNRLTANSSDYVGRNLVVKQEKVAGGATYALVEFNGTTLGWININGIRGNYNSVSETRNVAYNATISNTNINIYNVPAWTRGNRLVANSSDYVGQNLVVRQEKIAGGATYALVEHNGTTLGWININGIRGDYATVLERRQVAYHATLSNRNINIYNVPAWTRGNKLTAYTRDHIGKNIVVKHEIVTDEATYARVDVNGKTLGWINTNGLRKNYYSIDERRTTSYNAVISRSTSNIYSTPAWTSGNVLVGNTSNYLGSEVEVKEEVVTEEASYALIALNGTVLGWLNKNSISYQPVVFLDAGHGGKDPGAIGYLDGRRINEKDLNLSITLKLRDRLEAQGYNVIMSRETDVFIDMVDRARMANNTNADIFVSIHHNNMPGNNSSVDGIETIYYHPSDNYPPIINKDMHNDPTRIAESRNLAHSVQNALIDSTDARYRRVFSGAYVVVRETTMPAIIPELGFMSNQNELRRITSSSYQELLIQGLVNGINNYFN